MVKTFRTARWVVQSFTTLSFISCDSLSQSDIEMILLEVMDRSSLGLCQEICQKQLAPLIAIVDDLAYAQAVLEAGADDFLLASFKPIEALLRVRKLTQSASVIRVGDLEVDLLAWNVMYQSCRVHLSAVEFRLLASLAKRAGQMVEEETILEEVWPPGAQQKTPAQVKTYIGRLRRKIEPDVQNPQYIITIPGAGYRLRNQRQWEARRHEVLRSDRLLKVSA